LPVPAFPVEKMFLPSKSLQKLWRTLSCCKNPARSHTQTFSRWLALLAYTVLAIGVPIPAGGLPASGEVFPCMNHRCGCHSAEQCWRDCCCMTMAEKLAWARENKVAPPDYVLAEVKSRSLLDRKKESKCCCCRPKPVKSCCESQSAAGCCEADQSASTPSKLGIAKSKQMSQGVSLLAALKCRGATDSWTGAPVSLTPPTISDAGIVVDVTGIVAEFIPLFSTRAISPPTPPPRSCRA
jgi:hypothetical protein